MVAEVFSNVAIGRRLHIPTLKCLRLNARLVNSDHGVIDQFRVGDARVILRVIEEENLDFFDLPNHHFPWLIPVYRIIQEEEGCIELS